MYQATLTFKDVFNIEYTRTVKYKDQDMFYAVLAGTIQGNLNAGSTLIYMEQRRGPGQWDIRQAS